MSVVKSRRGESQLDVYMRARKACSQVLVALASGAGACVDEKSALSDAEIATEAGASPLTFDAGGNYVFDVPDETLQTNKVIFGGLDGWIKTGGGTLLEDAYLRSFKGTGVVETGLFRTSIDNPLPAMSGLSIASGATFEFGPNANYAGTLSGTGTMRFSGFGTDALSGAGWPSFTGTYQLYAANVDFGTAASPLAIASGAALDVANGGALNFHDDVTVRKLGGVGLMGAVNVPAGVKPAAEAFLYQCAARNTSRCTPSPVS